MDTRRSEKHPSIISEGPPHIYADIGEPGIKTNMKREKALLLTISPEAAEDNLKEKHLKINTGHDHHGLPGA